MRFLVFLLLLIVSQQGVQAQDIEIELLRSRLIEDALVNKGFVPRVGHYITPDFDAASKYLEEQSFDGSWSSVDYLDTDNSWDPLSALDKILVMSVAYNQSSDPLYHDEKLLKGIERALTYWYQVDPTCVNWYKNDIAKQMYLGPIAILMQDQIRDDLLYQMIEDQTPAPRMTGSNRTLVSTSVFLSGSIGKKPFSHKIRYQRSDGSCSNLRRRRYSGRL